MPPPPADAPTMRDRLALEPDGDDRFVSASPTDPRHVFGGLLIGQALRAAQLTVPLTRAAHALHASFVVAGRPEQHLRHAVERTRDGGSFSTRRVAVTQDHGAVLVLTADFHDDEPGVEYQIPTSTVVPPPDDLPAGRYETPWFEARDVDPASVRGAPPHARHTWFHPTAPVGDDPLLHLQAIAYLSDHGPTRAAREPHAHLSDDARRMSVSLDHSVWFHRPASADGWLLYELLPLATGRGRGLSLGTIRTAEGDLVATVAQEVLLRERPA